jgi:hypothetical protein
MSLLRTARRAAVASAVHGRVQQRQRERWGAESQAAAPPPAPASTPAPAHPAPTPASTDELISQLERLGKLRDSGILTEAEFAAQKARLLG